MSNLRAVSFSAPCQRRVLPPPCPFDRLRTGSPIKGEEVISHRSTFPSLGGLRLLEPTARGGGVRGGGGERALASKHGDTTLDKTEHVLEKWLDKAGEKGSLCKFPHKEVRSVYFWTKASAPLARGRRFFSLKIPRCLQRGSSKMGTSSYEIQNFTRHKRAGR